MRKRIIGTAHHDSTQSDDGWLNLDDVAEVEVTSEDAAHPIESALLPSGNSGWRAAEPGEQIIRLLFSQPQSLHRISLRFEDRCDERTQEYVLRWSADHGQTFREIVRQQWNFSPSGAPVETEVHECDLPAVTWLELCINPDTNGTGAIASLERLRLA